MDIWKHKSSMEVTLTVETEFSDPTVELTLYESDRETELQFKGESSLSWPIEMTQVGDTNEFSAVIPCDEIDWSPGDWIWRVISFDDGSENCRDFTSLGRVEHG